MGTGSFMRYITTAALVAFLMQTSGCYTSRMIAVSDSNEKSEALMAELVGKTVELTLKDGQKLQGVVVEYKHQVVKFETADDLQDIDIEDISQVKHRDSRNVEVVSYTLVAVALVIVVPYGYRAVKWVGKAVIWVGDNTLGKTR
jgi:hypothetical protein